ncbi:LacI family DNA-binding transcriptional regulator [bacterium]|nr:LacI family DNA-binding transcriptional regulator [bacterium]
MNPSKNSVTIRDVAFAAGVSVSTVSRVLNDKDDVAPETAAAVHRVIEELGYASSMAARSLRSRTTGVVGLIVPDLWHPFTAMVIKGISHYVSAVGYDLLAYASAGRNKDDAAGWEQQLVARLNGSVTDGIIVVTPHAATYRTAFPVVAVDPQQSSTDFPAVISTNHQGVMEAVSYLIRLGHRRIGFIGGRPGLRSSIRRLQGYQEALAQADIGFDPTLVVSGDYNRPAAIDCTHRLLALTNPPTAIMAANDDSAFGVYQAVAERGLCLPCDLSVVGFDNIIESASVDPPLTTVDQSIEGMGALAAEIVLNLIQGKAWACRLNKVPTRLVIRQSCRQIG